MSLVTIAVALPWVVVAVGCWIGYQLIRQNGRMLLRLESLEQEVAALTTEHHELAEPSATPAPIATGLPIGSPAPSFELPDLSGSRHALAEWRGWRLLLVFFNPQCGFCLDMCSALAALPLDRAPLPLIVTTGEEQLNREIVGRHALRCPVLLQEEMIVASAFQVGGTPMGYLIDEQGNIASTLAAGADALLALAGAHAQPATREDRTGRKPKYRGNRTLADSRINRHGLPAGTPAPSFRLARVGGGELALEQYRGRHVLLVFSDPNCGPCDELAPKLEQIHGRRPDVDVVMISRGSAEDNRQKIAEHGLTFPVVLQRQWEISRRYGMFGTPIGYLIDHDGIVAADVAVGADAILALEASATTRHELLPQ